uniref:Cyclin-C n=1 Tax=Magallana gigas TaxID=29159 RepID=K1PU71_MAGGI
MEKKENQEFGVISNSRLMTTCQTVVKNKFSHAYPQEYPYRINSVLECEFFLLEMMDCCLVLYHPYRPLTEYFKELAHEDSLYPLAWRIINDSLRTDVCLLYPPYLIALACLHIASVIQQKDLKQWLAECSVDMDKSIIATRCRCSATGQSAKCCVMRKHIMGKPTDFCSSFQKTEQN